MDSVDYTLGLKVIKEDKGIDMKGMFLYVFKRELEDPSGRPILLLKYGSCEGENKFTWTENFKPNKKLYLFWASERDPGVERSFTEGIEVNFGDDKVKTVTFNTKSSWTQTSFTKSIDIGPFKDLI